MRLIKAKPEFDLTSLDHLPFSLKEKGNQATVETLAGGGWSISTLGKDPFVMTTGFAEAHQPETPYILAFEYQAPPESTPLVLYFLTESGVRNQTLDTSPANGWKWHLHDFSLDGRGLDESLKWVRIDFGTEADRTYRIRNCRLIPANRELRQRAKLGQYFDRLSRFGIALDQVKSQRTTIETARKQDKQGVAVTISAYRHLDLDAETKRLAKEPSASPPVPLGPRIVAGEGEHPDNHTVVRILSPYQVCETQFLAYPPEIRGGVGVETGLNAKGETVILTYPLRSSRSEQLRFFNEGGGFLGSIIPPDKLSGALHSLRRRLPARTQRRRDCGRLAARIINQTAYLRLVFFRQSSPYTRGSRCGPGKLSARIRLVHKKRPDSGSAFPSKPGRKTSSSSDAPRGRSRGRLSLFARKIPALRIRLRRSGLQSRRTGTSRFISLPMEERKLATRS